MPRRCTVCAHPRLEEIDQAIVGAEPFRSIANRIEGVTDAAIGRHARSHLSQSIVKIQTDRGKASAGKVLDRVESLASKLEGLLDDAEEAGKHQVMLSTARELRGALELLAKMTGELKDQAGPTINILSAPDWLAVRAVIVDALHHHPAALQTVVDALAATDFNQRELPAGDVA